MLTEGVTLPIGSVIGIKYVGDSFEMFHVGEYGRLTAVPETEFLDRIMSLDDDLDDTP
jgi:hypothetical protein